MLNSPAWVALLDTAVGVLASAVGSMDVDASLENEFLNSHVVFAVFVLQILFLK